MKKPDNLIQIKNNIKVFNYVTLFINIYKEVLYKNGIDKGSNTEKMLLHFLTEAANEWVERVNA